MKHASKRVHKNTEQRVSTKKYRTKSTNLKLFHIFGFKKVVFNNVFCIDLFNSDMKEGSKNFPQANK